MLTGDMLKFNRLSEIIKIPVTVKFSGLTKQSQKDKSTTACLKLKFLIDEFKSAEFLQQNSKEWYKNQAVL